jgi:exonuclease III
VNAHLLYGSNRVERRREFDALLEWLVARSRKTDRLYAANYILVGDLNLDFDETDVMREEIDARIRALNATRLSSLADARCNFPLLNPHPKHGQLWTNARRKQTYDQIGFFSVAHDLPSPQDNRTAGSGGISGYDYGVFSFTDLFATALHGVRYDELSAARQDEIIAACEYDVSDHLPVSVRIPRV